MTPNEYQEAAVRTESPVTGTLLSRLDAAARLIHGSQGLATESGELTDTIKRHIFYNAPLDKVNMIEEVGDALWYLALICDACGGNLEQAMEANIKKLNKRYPNLFTERDAVQRNLDLERKGLEGDLS